LLTCTDWECLFGVAFVIVQTSRGVLKQRALKVAQHFFKRALDEYSQRGVDAARTMAAIQMHRCTVSSSGWESKLSKTLDFIKQQVESIRNERGLGGQHDIALQERQLDVLQAEVWCFFVCAPKIVDYLHFVLSVDCRKNGCMWLNRACSVAQRAHL